MPQGPTRADVKNERATVPNEEPQAAEVNDKASPSRPKSDRWSHDGFDQLMKVQDRGYQHQRNDSRPRSMNAKVWKAPFDWF